MPNFAFLVTCDKVIVDSETHTVSAISLFTKLTANIPEPPPPDAVIPKEWAVLAGWDSEDEDIGKEFVQCIEIFFAGGKPFIDTIRVMFKIDKTERQYNSIRLFGFPLGQAGRCELKTWLEHDGIPITDKHSTYLIVEHQVVPIAVAPPAIL
jgi:hypothetical protein